MTDKEIKTDVKPRCDKGRLGILGRYDGGDDSPFVL